MFAKNILDLIGNKYSRLTVLEPVKKYKRTYLKCQCDCGNVKDVKMSHVKSGRIKSCGCYNVEKLKERKGQESKLLKPNNYSAKYRLYKKYEKEAEKRGYSFLLDFDYFIDLTEENCYYCGQEPNKTIKGRGSRSTHIYNGIDRVNNEEGYREDNCVPCCTQCNISKRCLSKIDFFKWIEKVRKFSKIPFSTPSGSSAMFDVDDTLICWETPEDMKEQEIEIDCKGVLSYRVPNHYNIELLKKFYESGHIVILWSGSGVRWCKAVVKALGLENHVHGCISKPSYYIDDIADPKKWMGKHGYVDMGGKRSGHHMIQDK